MKKVIWKIKKIINYYNAYNTKYQVPKYSSSISFYMLISLIYILTIAIQIITYSSDIVETFMLTKVIHIFSDNFSKVIMDILPHFSLSGFSIVLLVNLLWSASKTISLYNRIADYIYYEIKQRVGWKSRLSAFLMFSMLVLVVIFEITLVFAGNYLIREVLPNSVIIVRVVQFILELFSIFLTLLILYIYAPPKKMHVKDAYKGAIFSTLLIYLLLSIFVLGVNAIKNLGIGYSIITVISLSLTILYFVNYIIITGMIINYFGNIFQLKTSLFRKQ